MKTLIIYATKHESTQSVAQRIANDMEGAVLCNLKQEKMPSLNQFDCIAIGSPVYAGMIRKEVKEFMKQNADVLSEKKVGVFLLGLNNDSEKTYFLENIPEKLLESAASVMFLGGVFDPKRSNFLEKAIMKAVAKTKDYMNTISDEKIDQFRKKLQE